MTDPIVKVSLLQTELIWEHPAKNLAHLDSVIPTSLNTNLLVLPEMFSTGFSMASSRLAEPMTGPTVTWMREKARALGCALCGSVIIEASGHFYNRFIWMSADGDHQHYDKRHLFRMSTEHQHYSAGSTRPMINHHGLQICPQICYDLRFPVWSRNDGQIDVLIYVANWPAARRDHWLALLKARAIENLCYVIGVNRIGADGNDVAYCGDSVAHDYNGSLIADLGANDGCVTIELSRKDLDAYRQGFPAHLDADSFSLD